MSISIRNSCLLYRPSIALWSGRKLDKDESSKVSSANGTVDGAARVHKDLLPECKELADIAKAGSALRQFVYLKTQPWDDSGWRVANVAGHMDFMAQVGDRITQIELLVDLLMNVYDQRVAEAQFKLNHLFKIADYPSATDVRRKYSFTVDVQPIPHAADIRVVEGISTAEADKLVAAAQSGVEAKINAAMEGVYQSLYDVVNKMATTLEGYDAKEIKKFNDTLVSNIADIVEAMPALNITGDPKLAEFARQAKDLSTYACVDLRKDQRARQSAAKEAKALAAAIKPAPVTTVSTPAAAVSADTFVDMLGG